jgi:hypothetical protein
MRRGLTIHAAFPSHTSHTNPQQSSDANIGPGLSIMSTRMVAQMETQRPSSSQPSPAHGNEDVDELIQEVLVAQDVGRMRLSDDVVQQLLEVGLEALVPLATEVVNLPILQGVSASDAVPEAPLHTRCSVLQRLA